MFALLLAMTISISSQASSTSASLLVAGDSWATLMCLGNSFQTSFSKHKIRNVKVLGCSSDKATKFGAHASKWLSYKEGKKMIALLKSSPDVKSVFLSIGGNDFLGDWNKKMSPQEEQELFAKILYDTKVLVNAIYEIRPDVKVLISGYDFGNFKDFIKVKPYVKLYKSMGSPTPFEINSALIRFSETMSAIADFRNVFYIQHIGLSHYYYGNPEFNLKAKTTLEPRLISNRAHPMSTGGVVELVAAKQSMLNILGLLVDAYHPTFTGFTHIADHAIENYISDWY